MSTKQSSGRRKGAYSQAARVLAILELVRSEDAPVPLTRIAAHFGLSERQARRDVAMLTEAGHGVTAVIVEGRSAVMASASDVVRLTPRERALLSSLAGVAGQLGHGALHGELGAALQKIALGAREERLEPATVISGPWPGVSASCADRIDRIERAIRDRHELRVRLLGEREGSHTMTFLPYVIALHPAGPHVVGRWEPAEPIRAIAIERFAHVEVALGTVVAAPQSLDLARAFEQPRPSAVRTAHS